jgi:hypothetical protein
MLYSRFYCYFLTKGCKDEQDFLDLQTHPSGKLLGIHAFLNTEIHYDIGLA